MNWGIATTETTYPKLHAKIAAVKNQGQKNQNRTVSSYPRI